MVYYSKAKTGDGIGGEKIARHDIHGIGDRRIIHTHVLNV